MTKKNVSVMSLEEVGKILNVSVSEITLDSLYELVAVGYSPIEGKFMLNGKEYVWVDGIHPDNEFEDDCFADYGYIETSDLTDVFYVLKDEDGNFVTHNSIMMYDEDKLYKKIAYMRYTGRCDGMRYYGSEKNAERTLSILTKMNSFYKLGHTFTIIKVDTNKMPAGNVLFDEIQVLKSDIK